MSQYFISCISVIVNVMGVGDDCLWPVAQLRPVLRDAESIQPCSIPQQI